MSLTGSVFLTAILAMTVAAFVGAVVLWPRMSGPGGASIAGRALVLLVVNALVLLTAATRLNADFQFFSDWTDLAGAFAHAPSVSVLHGGTSASKAARIEVPHSAARPGAGSSVLPAVSGAATVASYTVSGPQSGITGAVVVQLPPGYTDLRNAQVRYPVLETFQGYPGSPYQWVDTMNLGGVMGSEVSARRMRPPVAGGLPDGDRDLPAARERARDAVGALVDDAAAAGVVLAIEPMHPIYAADRGVISTLGQALDVAEPFPAQTVGVLVDTFHVWWDPQLDEQIDRAGRGGRIAAYQVCDWITPLPDPLLGRGIMGDGHIAFGPVTRAVLAAGYAGDIEVEIFNQEIWDADPAEIARRAVRAFDACVAPSVPFEKPAGTLTGSQRG